MKYNLENVYQAHIFEEIGFSVIECITVMHKDGEKAPVAKTDFFVYDQNIRDPYAFQKEKLPEHNSFFNSIIFEKYSKNHKDKFDRKIVKGSIGILSEFNMYKPHFDVSEIDKEELEQLSVALMLEDMSKTFNVKNILVLTNKMGMNTFSKVGFVPTGNPSKFYMIFQPNN